MISFEDACWQLESAANELLKQLASSPMPDKMPDDLPPVAQRLWNHCKGIIDEMNSKEFEEIEP